MQCRQRTACQGFLTAYVGHCFWLLLPLGKSKEMLFYPRWGSEKTRFDSTLVQLSEPENFLRLFIWLQITSEHPCHQNVSRPGMGNELSKLHHLNTNRFSFYFYTLAHPSPGPGHTKLEGDCVCTVRKQFPLIRESVNRQLLWPQIWLALEGFLAKTFCRSNHRNLCCVMLMFMLCLEEAAEP